MTNVPIALLATYMIWMMNRIGYNEKNNDKELSQYWIYAQLAFTTIVGAAHAWCAMIGCTALEENGYMSARTAGAHNMFTGRKCPLQINCGVIIKHGPGHPLAGHFHFTFCYRLDEDGLHFWGLGGNQNDEISIAKYPIADVFECFMPELRPTDPNEIEGHAV